MFRICAFLIVLISSGVADDRFYDLGRKFLNGSEGSVEEKKIVNNCPYEACKLNDGKIRTIDISTPNTKDGIALLEQSVAVNDNEKAAALIVSTLLSKVNYRDKEPAEFLVKNIKKEFGLEYKDFQLKVKKYVDYLYSKNSCEGFYWRGHLGMYFYIYKDTSSIYYSNITLAQSICDKNKNTYYSALVRADMIAKYKATFAEY